MRTRRTFLVALLAFALAMPSAPVQALPTEGFQINYYQWDWQTESYVLVGQETMHCFMPWSQSWGKTDFGIDECGAIKEVFIFNCDTGQVSYDAWWWTGTGWSYTAVCHA